MRTKILVVTDAMSGEFEDVVEFNSDASAEYVQEFLGGEDGEQEPDINLWLYSVELPEDWEELTTFERARIAERGIYLCLGDFM